MGSGREYLVRPVSLPSLNDCVYSSFELLNFQHFIDESDDEYILVNYENQIDTIIIYVMIEKHV